MFSKNKNFNSMAKINEVDNTTINLIGQGTSIEGEIVSTGDIRIDGTMIGNIKTKGKLIIGQTGSVDGEITCQNADFSGNIKAKVIVSELLSLKATAKFSGEITTNKLAIEPGAGFSGTCNMHKQQIKQEITQNEKPETTKS